MSKLFFGGIPLKPNVDALMQGIQLQAGNVYSHEDISRICGEPYKSNRYRSIVAAWRKRLIKERGIDIAAELGIGYRVLLDSERISVGNKQAMHGLKQIRFGGEKAMRAEEANLTDSEKRQRMQLMRMTADLVKIGKESEHQFVVLGKVTAVENTSASQ